jgi:hypothetical protein
MKTIPATVILIPRTREKNPDLLTQAIMALDSSLRSE